MVPEKVSRRLGSAPPELTKRSADRSDKLLRGKDAWCPACRLCFTTPRLRDGRKGRPNEKAHRFFALDRARLQRSAGLYPDPGLRATERDKQASGTEHQTCDWTGCRYHRVAWVDRKQGACAGPRRLQEIAIVPDRHASSRRRLSIAIPQFHDACPSRQCGYHVPATAARLLQEHSDQILGLSLFLVGCRRSKNEARERTRTDRSQPAPSIASRSGCWRDESARAEFHGFYRRLLEQQAGIHRALLARQGASQWRISNSPHALRELTWAAQAPRFPGACVQGPNEPSEPRFPPRPIRRRAGGVLCEDSRWHLIERVQRTPKRIAMMTPSSPTADGQSPWRSLSGLRPLEARREASAKEF